MTLFLSKIVSSILQIVLFSVIPFVWWFITARKHEKFSSWIGLKRIDGGKKTFAATIMLSVAFILSGVISLYLIRGVETATSEFTGLGVTAIPAILVYAIFNTALPEELLFRGFLLKRLANKFGFYTANLLQALLFGLIHGVMFFAVVGVVKAVLIILFTGAVAWFMGCVNEQSSNGSIIPGWIIHATSNLFSGICAAFSII